MKLTQNTKKNKGMTLLELTVVILVLLSLISVLFIGARAWKKGADRAGCILNIRNVQQAVRSHANMTDLNATDALLIATITGTGNFIEVAPVCPNDGAVYGYGTVVGDIGVLYAACGNADAVIKATHIPTTFTGW